jgi:hypothetical protein
LSEFSMTTRGQVARATVWKFHDSA